MIMDRIAPGFTKEANQLAVVRTNRRTTADDGDVADALNKGESDGVRRI